MNKKVIFISLVFFICITSAIAQNTYWQQRVEYNMDIDLNVKTNQFTGKQKLTYYNNSPDTLKKVFYHLYFNAFQPNSLMDVSSRNSGKIILGYDYKNQPVADWDSRVKDRIYFLKNNEIGYQKIKSLTIKGKEQNFSIEGTILKVNLSEPILPNSSVVIEMIFEAQVPLQIRRSGRDNAEGVRYTMTQWYPKICAYDKQGWHAEQYIGREFYGVWGDFFVNITIDKKYMLAGTGEVTNSDEVGFGYSNKIANRKNSNTLTWNFVAKNVHDFAWAADPDYVHQTKQVNKDLLVRLFYKKNSPNKKDWENLLSLIERTLPYIEKYYGKYPYPVFSFIEGGDGGMEYPMATMLNSPEGALHEFLHSWYYGILANNEVLYPWMDEGFVQYAQERVWAYLKNQTNNIQQSNYENYLYFLEVVKDYEPLSTNANFYTLNYTYQSMSYYKGAVFLAQLEYLVGKNVMDKILMNYYEQYKFKNPTPDDFVKVAEQESGLALQWYQNLWINTNKQIDYAVDTVWMENNKTKIRLKNVGDIPMPLEIKITYNNGKEEWHYIPVDLLLGEKNFDDKKIIAHKTWGWVNKTYIFETETAMKEIKKIEIDPDNFLADVNRGNNKFDSGGGGK